MDEEKGEETKLFLPESSIENFFRKMDWAPDGSFFISLCGELKEQSNSNSFPFCAYAFHRNSMK